MGKASKRKRRDYSTNDVNDFGLADTVAQVMRPRLSESTVSSAASTTSKDSQGFATQAHKAPLVDHDHSENRDWITMVSRKKRKLDTEEQKSTYPEIVFHTKQQAPIRIQDLQSLALYSLTDGIGPSWLTFKNVRETRKVVVLMVPGLEMEMFDGSWNSSSSEVTRNGHSPDDHFNGNQNGDHKADHLANDPIDPRPADFAAWKSGKPIAQPKLSAFDGAPTTLDSNKLRSSFEPITKVFTHIWPVRSPGDSRYSKVHSPLQAMLVSSIPAPLENKGMKAVRPPAEEKTFQPVRTPITAFIHSADELREANYPVHPACFTSTVDAQLELERRKKTGQSPADGWVDTKVISLTPVLPEPRAPAGDLTCGLTVYALDCEMVLTTDDVHSLARISLISYPSNKVIVDKYVKPTLPVKDYFTQYSGVTPAHLATTTTTLADIQSELLELFSSSTILLGHSLESDLNALKMTHAFLIDTALIYPHPRGPPLRSALKYLATKYLRRDIQSNASGHDSIEDARAVLDLVKLKCEKGSKWGTSEAQGEPLFRRLSRAKGRDGSTRLSAMVDYGTPERGYGKEADVKIGCTNDDEIVEGVTRAVNGDLDGKEIKAGGVDFVWSRLRNLEFARGWGKESQVDETGLNGQTETADHNGALAPYLVTLEQTLTRIEHIHTALPPCTLLIVYSGTGDPRPLVRLQKQQAQFRKEFKVKKWDELSVRWTDDEEQALKAAAEKARNGVGFVCVK